MPRHELETFYKATQNACRYLLRLPSSRLIQDLVQGWRACGRGARLTRQGECHVRASAISWGRSARKIPAAHPRVGPSTAEWIGADARFLRVRTLPVQRGVDFGGHTVRR